MKPEILDEDFEGYKGNALDPNKVKEINLLKIEIDESIKFVKGGRAALVALGVFAAATVLFSWVDDTATTLSTDLTIGLLVLAILYGGIAYGVKHNALIFLSTGLFVFLSLQVLSIVSNWGYVYQGWIIKFVFLFMLVKGVHGAYQLDQYTEKLYEWGLSMSEIENIKKLKKTEKTI